MTEADQVNNTVSKYDYGIDQLVRLDNQAEGRSFFHLDFLGSTVGLTDPAGGSRQSIFYDAWGKERDRIGASANNFTFTGHELDEETGLIYAKARFYDSEVGRFLSQDTLLGDAADAPSLNRYVYTRGNPTTFVDPDGRLGEPVTTTTTLTYILDIEYIAAGGGGAAAGAFSVPGVGLILAAIGGVKAVVYEREAEARLRLEEQLAGVKNDQVRQRGRIILEGENAAERILDEQRREQLRERGVELGRADEAQGQRGEQKAKVVKEGRDGNSRLVDSKSSSERDFHEDLDELDLDADDEQGELGFDEESERAWAAEQMVREEELSIRTFTGRGSQNPRTREAQEFGVRLHQDQPGGFPEQLRERYPDTQFRFTEQGKKGQDVEVVGGRHPSEYPGSRWPEGVDYGDFKPGTEEGRKTFDRDQRTKWKERTHFLPYDPETGLLRNDTKGNK